MKKKLTAVALIVCMLAIMLVGASLAYFTDTQTATNTFTTGNVEIKLIEKGLDADGKEVDWEDAEKELFPGSKTMNNVKKSVTVKNIGDSDAYMWIEVWVPAALDDGDDNSPAAPGLGNSLHFNYDAGVVETKADYLSSKTINGVAYNGYVHYVAADAAKETNESTVALLDQVYMDKAIVQCENEDCECGGKGLILMDGETCYMGDWELIINAVGFQAEGFDTITDAITAYYEKDVTAHIW